MAIAFTYTESSNTVELTGGTSGTPALFSDFVTADRAGTDTLLKAATAGTNSVTLTYAVRPVEFLAIVVKCTVASKTAETDYIFITGTDAWGVAQTESIDVSAGNGAYTTTKRFATISNLDCSDNAVGGGTAWADGTIKITQDVWGVIWDRGNNEYRIDATFNIGNGSTSTYFKSTDIVFWTNAMFPRIRTSATCECGTLTSSEHSDTCVWSLGAITGTWRKILDGGTVYFYATHILIRTPSPYLQFETGTVVWNRVILEMNGARLYFQSGLSSLSLTNVYVMGASYIVQQKTPTTFSGIHFNAYTGYFAIEDSCSATGLNLTNYPAIAIDLYTNKTFTDINPKWAVDTDDHIRTAASAGRVYIWQLTCDINVSNGGGIALSGATVDCYDSLGNAVWTVGSVTTDASGDITQQNIIYKKKEYPNTITTYSPHKFIIFKAGYERLVLDNITVDAQIDWHHKLRLATHLHARRDRMSMSGVSAQRILT